MNYPLRLTIRRRGPRKRVSDAQGHRPGPHGPSEDVPVFAYAVINGNTNMQSATQYDARLFVTVERLQVIAPPDTFPLLYDDYPTVVETTEGAATIEWERVDAEENYDNNPFWAPGLSVFYFERRTRIN